MTHVDTTTTPRKRNRRPAAKTLVEFIADLRAAHPTAKAAELRQRALDDLTPNVLADDGWEKIVAQLFEDGLRIHIIDRPTRQRAQSPAPTPQERQQKRRTIKAELARRLDDHIELKVALKLLDYVTLFGKPLGDCTGADCKKLSVRDRDFFGEIAKRISPSEHVRNHLTEHELQAIHRTCRLA